MEKPRAKTTEEIPTLGPASPEGARAAAAGATAAAAFRAAQQACPIWAQAREGRKGWTARPGAQAPVVPMRPPSPLLWVPRSSEQSPLRVGMAALERTVLLASPVRAAGVALERQRVVEEVVAARADAVEAVALLGRPAARPSHCSSSTRPSRSTPPNSPAAMLETAAKASRDRRVKRRVAKGVSRCQTAAVEAKVAKVAQAVQAAARPAASP